MKQFWLVWNVGGGQPLHQHDSEHSALLEAERLAGRNPGEAFAVMEAIHARKVDNMRRIDFRKQEADEIPF